MNINKQLKAVFCSSLCVMVLCASAVFATDDGNKEESNSIVRTIQSVNELEEAIELAEKDGKITIKEKKEIASKTEPEVIGDYYVMKAEKAFDAIEGFDVDEGMKGDNEYSSCEKKVTIDDGTDVVIEFEDGEDRSLLSDVKDKIIPNVSAATNGETLWKKYGNRYFTAKATIPSGIGAGRICLENHYKVSSKGLDERYGDAYVSFSFSAGITGSISPGNPIITDSVARTEGKSDINMYCRFNFLIDGGGYANYSVNWKLSTTVKYLKKNASKKQIKVKHSWKKS